MEFLKIKEEVQRALNAGKPVVALESTIISHGFPYPQNVELAVKVEETIREQGAVPATIAIMDGNIKIGLTTDEIERLGKSRDAFKTSIHDIPRVLAGRKDGATTVAATMFAAEQAGIRFFATGGLGGVHYGVDETFDISADLLALAKTKVCIVSAGVKSILDIPKTVEYLETAGVPIYGYETDRYPGFYIRDTGITIEKLDKYSIAELLKVQDKLNLNHAVSVVVPIPEEDELDAELIDKVIKEALQEAKDKHISGKEVTPFLLSKIKDITEGSSVKANFSLMINNAKTAAQLAKEYYQ
ncbi:pseudouridine-5'-phosphate glycosidase [Salipaludibacillus aurantiacus]|uniref:Pseudouridine-5'-phosphate glycosidase n=1 Tax=Salipaludibacillus aurantiacus TaxID=1601833 RepID=A0A1H9UCC3_9BACI|nr:pseudouridine-5'-phosphate glycosidase [Salipaludibacillus aurantiacus]SES07009.1 pseudouridine-5'-phosphate glycosidase [Salipaludibacillus aurantiacus]